MSDILFIINQLTLTNMLNTMEVVEMKEYLKALVYQGQDKDTGDEMNKPKLVEIINENLSNPEIYYIHSYVSRIEKESGERSVRIKEIILGNVISVKLECFVQFESK